jgi:hypothetical protein
MPGAFDGFRKQALMRRADSTDSPGQYLSPFGNKVTEELSVLEIDVSDFFRAKLTDSLAPNAEPSWTWHSSSPFYRVGTRQPGPIPDENLLQIGRGRLFRLHGTGLDVNIRCRLGGAFFVPCSFDLVRTL